MSVFALQKASYKGPFCYEDFLRILKPSKKTIISFHNTVVFALRQETAGYLIRIPNRSKSHRKKK